MPKPLERRHRYQTVPGSPRITIVTPSYQQAAFLGDCLASVHGQQGVVAEHIVVDGGSTDGSRAIIERSAGRLAWWCSEADRGQSHAINKGLDRATGEVFGWINSDDALLPGALSKVAAAFREDGSLITLTGVRVLRTEGRPDEPMPAEEADDRLAWYTAPRINQQATFHRTESLRAIGGVEERLRYVMDYELWLQLLFRHGEGSVRAVPWPLAAFRQHGASKTATQKPAFVQETASVLHGLCRASGLSAVAEALAVGHPITPGLRAMPVDAGQAPVIGLMVQRFLLIWHREPHSRNEFEMMRAWRAAAPRADADPSQTERRAELDRHLSAPNWLAYRARRKWKHLFR